MSNTQPDKHAEGMDLLRRKQAAAPPARRDPERLAAPPLKLHQAKPADAAAEAKRQAEAGYADRMREAFLPPLHCDHLAALDRGGPWGKTLARLEKRLPRLGVVALLGDRGTGKTQLAACVVSTACRQGHACRYTRAFDLFAEFNSVYRDGGPSRQEVLARYLVPAVLVIDEVHQRAGTAAELNNLTNLIDHRYGRQLGTVLIANETAAGFAALVGDSVVSRTREAGGAIVCDWPSFRERKAVPMR